MGGIRDTCVCVGGKRGRALQWKARRSFWRARDARKLSGQPRLSLTTGCLVTAGLSRGWGGGERGRSGLATASCHKEFLGSLSCPGWREDCEQQKLSLSEVLDS